MTGNLKGGCGGSKTPLTAWQGQGPVPVPVRFSFKLRWNVQRGSSREWIYNKVLLLSRCMTILVVVPVVAP